jgi:hypothetical protein
MPGDVYVLRCSNLGCLLAVGGIVTVNQFQGFACTKVSDYLDAARHIYHFSSCIVPFPSYSVYIDTSSRASQDEGDEDAPSWRFVPRP